MDHFRIVCAVAAHAARTSHPPAAPVLLIEIAAAKKQQVMRQVVSWQAKKLAAQRPVTLAYDHSPADSPAAAIEKAPAIAVLAADYP